MSPKKKATLGAAVTPPPKEPSELERIEAEMREISPRLKEIQANDPENYTRIYNHYLNLVEQRTQLLKEQ